MRWLDGITDLIDMSLNKTPGEGQGSLTCCSTMGVRVRHDLGTEQQQRVNLVINGLSFSVG